MGLSDLIAQRESEEKRGQPSAQADMALKLALRERDFAIKEDRENYDDEIVTSNIHQYPANALEGPPRRYIVVTTKRGRTWEKLLGDHHADWIEIAPPVPGTDGRRTFNDVRKASGDVADAQQRIKDETNAR